MQQSRTKKIIYPFLSLYHYYYPFALL